jgi:hypothetical protein
MCELAGRDFDMAAVLQPAAKIKNVYSQVIAEK